MREFKPESQKEATLEVETPRHDYIALPSLHRPEQIGSEPLIELYERMKELDEESKYALHDRAWCALEAAEALHGEGDAEGTLELLRGAADDIAQLTEAVNSDFADRTDVRGVMLNCNILYFAARLLDEPPEAVAGAAAEAYHDINERVVAPLLGGALWEKPSMRGGLLAELTVMQLANWKGRHGFFTPSSRRENSAWGKMKGDNPDNLGFDLRYYCQDSCISTVVRPGAPRLPIRGNVAKLRAFDFTPSFDGSDSVLHLLLQKQQKPNEPCEYESELQLAQHRLHRHMNSYVLTYQENKE
jgi:hypothetical protein